jgi:FkbM family methyltransferase
MALCTGMTGITIGFDPNPYVFKILETNANLNKDKYVIHPHRCAISATPKSFYYISSEASFGNGAISETRDSKHGKFVFDGMVEGIHLKTFLETKYASMIQKLSFIKIDTEGYDKEIIKSISDLIQAYKPVIVAESFGKASEAAKVELFEVIKNNGYDIFYFADFDINATVIELKVPADLVNYSQTINVYAVPQK